MQNLGVFGESVADRGRRRDRWRRQDGARRSAAAASGAARLGRWRLAMPMAADGGGRADGRRSGRRRRPMAAAASAPPVEPTIRQNFADTALWVGALETDADGTGRGRARHARESHHLEDQRLGHGPRHARRPGLGRGRHPQEHHRAAAGPAVLRRDATRSCSRPTSTTTSRRPSRSACGWSWKAARSKAPSDWSKTVEIPAGGETARRLARERRPRRRRPIVRMSALTDEESDAMQMSFPVLRPRHAQDRVVQRRHPPRRRRRGELHVHRARGAAARADRGWKSATRRRSPGRWSTPCPTWPTTPTAAPSRRSTASCRRCITQQHAAARWASI